MEQDDTPPMDVWGEDGSPAFPASTPTVGGGSVHYKGTTLRAWVSGMALSGLGANINPHLPGDMASFSTFPDSAELAERRAKWAVLQADALIAELARKGGAE